MRNVPWYKNAIIYAVDIETFLDSNGDGVGDAQGLITKLDYLAALGVTCLWLLPFYGTPDHDNGYDVRDYYGVDPRVGTLGDIAILLREADARGLRVILDLVIQHTSNEHPWFESARCDPDSPYRDFYVWRDEPPEEPQRTQIVYEDDEQDRSPWTFDERAGAYYLHHFYDFEPDLNLRNPLALQEVDKIIGFWCQLGAAGYRIDAAPFLGALEAAPEPDREEAHRILRHIRAVSTGLRGNAVLIGEVDDAPEHLAGYFSDGHALQMLFNFILNNYLFLALARDDAEPIRRALGLLPEIPKSAQWVHWVRNYDELDLERLSDDERQEVCARFAPEPEMRLYERGIRRRLPPMVDGDRRRMELAYSLMFSLPGTPCLFPGEEIGMGENLNRPGRSAVRAPMQWSGEPNAGFSTAAAERLVGPVIADGPFAYERVNVADQRQDPDSFLNWMKRLIWTRRESPAIGAGEWRAIQADCSEVLALGFQFDGHSLLVLHNLSDKPLTATLDLGDLLDDGARTVLCDSDYSAVDAHSKAFELEPYGYRWIRSGETIG